MEWTATDASPTPVMAWRSRLRPRRPPDRYTISSTSSHPTDSRLLSEEMAEMAKTAKKAKSAERAEKAKGAKRILRAQRYERKEEEERKGGGIRKKESFTSSSESEYEDEEVEKKGEKPLPRHHFRAAYGVEAERKPRQDLFLAKDVERVQQHAKEARERDDRAEEEREWPYPQNPTHFGPPTWNCLHGTAQLSAFRGELARRCIVALPRLLMCPTCAGNFADFIKREPLTKRNTADSRGVEVWLSAAHNDVNQRLNKPQVDIKSLMERTQGQPLTTDWQLQTLLFLYYLADHYHPSLLRVYTQFLNDLCAVWKTDKGHAASLARALAQRLNLKTRHSSQGCWASRYLLVQRVHQAERDLFGPTAATLHDRVNMLKKARLTHRTLPSAPTEHHSSPLSPTPLPDPIPTSALRPTSPVPDKSRRAYKTSIRKSRHSHHYRKQRNARAPPKPSPHTIQKAPAPPPPSASSSAPPVVAPPLLKAAGAPLFRFKMKTCAHGCGI